MLSAIRKELSMRHQELRDKNLKSLYLGGGTPSILEVDEINFLLDDIQNYFEFDNNIEITLEANPDDLDQKFLKALSKTEINRLSIGTQSFFEDDLKMMNRAHNASQAEGSIKRAQDLGFENLSVDLIYGSPTADFNIWKQNLQKIIELKIPHVSSYALTVEPKTALQQWILTQKIKAPDEAEQNDEFYYMTEFLKKNGFQHYEISNFGKSGFHSKHNSAYWQYQPYLGLGPSAHSYNGSNTRSWNIANNSKYIQSISESKLALETEILSEKDQYNEMLMIGLRTVWGVDVSILEDKFSDEVLSHFRNSIKAKINEGILEIENKNLRIPEKHWFLADGIAADLFMID